MDFGAVFSLQGFRPALRRLVLGSAALVAAAGFAPAQSGETILHSFKGAPDGDTPVAGLIFDSDGALYGTTKFGGLSTFGPGVVFKLTPLVPPATKWTKTVLYRFQGGNDGANPVASLVFWRALRHNECRRSVREWRNGVQAHAARAPGDGMDRESAV
jgi:uncharacterized repeat protein (TIGR03803 family)